LERRDQVLEVIKKNPGIRFNEIMRITDMKNGTLSHYVKKLEDENHIELERSPRVTRLYPAGIPREEAEICKYLNMPTQKKILLFMLEKKIVTSIQVRDHIKKSPSVVSVNLNELFKARVIDRKYDIPSNKFSIKKPELVKGVLNEYFPDLIDRLSSNTDEMLDI
jgi:predicted transcriptional regulator|tara:strand:- start:29 stop:523 length:495 start_codon:yes stop_codon:yes gene_type:complete